VKILHVAKAYPPELGGIERYVADLAEFARDAHHVVVLANNGRPGTLIEEVNGVHLIRAHVVARPMSQPISLDLVNHIARVAPDLIHFHAPNPWGCRAVLKVSGATPVVVSHHADIIGREPMRTLTLALYRRLCRRAVAVSFTAERNMLRCKDVPDDVKNSGKCSTLHCPVVLGPFVDDPRVALRAAEMRAQFPSDQPLAAFVGRLVAYKGLGVALDALSRTNDIHLAVAGSGPMLPALQKKAHALGLSGRVTFLGTLGDLDKHALLNACDFFVLPSTTTAEAFGIAMAEAMLWGKPVIASELDSGVMDVCLKDRTGLAVQPGDPISLAAAMQRMGADPGLRRQMGDTARAHAQANFTPMVLAPQLLDLYARALEQSAQ
jgi:glycosyltransferase involved in cell wall biosynthesis